MLCHRDQSAGVFCVKKRDDWVVVMTSVMSLICLLAIAVACPLKATGILPRLDSFIIEFHMAVLTLDDLCGFVCTKNKQNKQASKQKDKPQILGCRLPSPCRVSSGWHFLSPYKKVKECLALLIFLALVRLKQFGFP